MADQMAHLTDFVLKIKFVGSDEDSTQIRRVRLPRICNGVGNVSYEELVGLCVHLVIPEKPSETSDFQVKLTYKDVDDDTIVIGSSEELLDAIDQYKEQRVLRVTAEVKRATKAKPPALLTQPTGDVPVSRASFHEPESSDAGVQTGDTGYSAGTPVLQNVVESVVNVILNAAVAINGRQAAQPEPVVPVFFTPEGVPSGSSSSETFNLEPTIVAIPEPGETALSSSTPVEETVSKGVKEAESMQAAATEELPFIHGRHTCDNCLTTPIVGKRYHALNMSDYDLCSKCFSDHGGGEIQFEAVELERDRHLQNRWNRRRERMNQNNARAPSRFGTRAHHTRWGPNSHRGGPPRGLAHRLPEPHSHVPPPALVPPAGIPPPHHGPFPPHPPKSLYPAMPVSPPQFDPAGVGMRLPPPVLCSSQVGLSWKGRDEQNTSEEDAMALAISLSLQEMKAATTAQKATWQPASPVEAKSVKQESSSSSSSSSSSTSSARKARSTTTMVEGREVVEALKVESVKVDAEEPTVALSTPTEREAKSTSGSVQVETVEEDEEESSVISEAFVIRMPSSDWSFASDVSKGKSRQVNARSPEKGSRETSFSSDAAGNGAIADMLGETLDKCAEAIDAMVSELDRASFDSRSATSSYAGVNDEADESFSSDINDEGATILEPVEAAIDQVGDDLQAEGGRGEEDWQVVGQDQQIGSDEELARAAQMIGSALFNSDMRSSGDMLSTLTKSGADDANSYASSGLTSVPSVTTQVAVSQSRRWAPQLAQLHTLGIVDETRCIEILEKLTAANIGCDNSEEVTVQEVIDELWK